MKQPSPVLFLFSLGLTLALTLSGCASGGGAGTDSLYRADLGRVMIQPLLTAREKIFGRYSIPMYREESSARAFLFESQWIPRQVTAEEALGGATGGRNRVFIRGTLAGENLDGTNVFRTRFEVQNQIQTATNPDWFPAPMPPEARQTYKRVFDELILELRTGVIR
jgi:hypothetical protein